MCQMVSINLKWYQKLRKPLLYILIVVFFFFFFWYFGLKQEWFSLITVRLPAILIINTVLNYLFPLDVSAIKMWMQVWICGPEMCGQNCEPVLCQVDTELNSESAAIHKVSAGVCVCTLQVWHLVKQRSVGDKRVAQMWQDTQFFRTFNPGQGGFFCLPVYALLFFYTVS